MLFLLSPPTPPHPLPTQQGKSEPALVVSSVLPMETRVPSDIT